MLGGVFKRLRVTSDMSLEPDAGSRSSGVGGKLTGTCSESSS